MGTAVGSPNQPVHLQQVQIAPNCFLGNPKIGSELSDIHGPATARLFQDSASSFIGVHGDTSVSRLCSACPRWLNSEARLVRALVAKFLQGECPY
jgi:hypothetical protein